MAVDKKIKYEDQPVIQGGVQNYLGKQPQVMAPRKWQSSPDKPATELAYITKAEKDLILKANIHGGLERGPNMGPSGIMSLDSFGDADAGVSGGLGGGDVSDAETGRSFAGANTISDKYGRDLRAGAVAAGGRERLNEPQSVLNQVRALQKQFGPRVGTSRFGFLNPSNIFSGIMGLINPALGLATRGFNFLKGKAQDLRGYNPDGTPRTQQQYEDFMAQKSLQNRFDKLMDRKLTGKNYSQKNLESLMNMGLTSSKNSLASALARDLEINPEMPQFATSYLGSLNKGITNTTPGLDFINAPQNIEGYNTITTPSSNPQDYDFLSNAMAEVTQKDINASKARGFNMMDYGTAVDLGMISPNVTEYEFEQLKQGNITSPGSYQA